MSKWYLFSSVFQALVGGAAIVSYVILALSGEPVSRWTVTLIVAIAFLTMGIVGIVDWTKNRIANKNDRSDKNC